MVWNNEKEEVSRLGWLALHQWQEWFLAQQEPDSHTSHNRLLSWTPPAIGGFKCSVDVGFNKQLGTSNRGWCVRDHLGNFFIAGAACDVGNLSIIEAEALTLKETIQGAICLHLNCVIFESDSLRVVQEVHSNNIGNLEFILIIRSIRALLSSFPNFKVEFIKYQVNMTVHFLSKATNS